jgi:hypothetical protein
MKKLFICLMIGTTLLSCNSNKSQVASSEVAGFDSYGAKITDEKAISSSDLDTKYSKMNVGDTINVKFKSTIKEVCQNKGCWMKLDLGNQKETFVKFKDYAFVIVNGKAFVSLESVEDQKHYAGDAGKSQAEIDKIVAPKKVYSFTADGVLIKK